MAVGHAIFLVIPNLYHTNKPHVLLLVLVLFNVLLFISSLFGLLKKENDYLDYSTNQDHDENKDLFVYLSKIIHIQHYYIVPGTYGPLQTHTHKQHYYKAPGTYGPLQTQTHTQHYYKAPGTYGPLQTQTHKQYYYKAPGTYGPLQIQTHTQHYFQVPDPFDPTQTHLRCYFKAIDTSCLTQIHSYSHTSHDLLGSSTTHGLFGSLQIETYTVIISDTFDIFGASHDIHICNNKGHQPKNWNYLIIYLVVILNIDNY